MKNLNSYHELIDETPSHVLYNCLQCIRDITHVSFVNVNNKNVEDVCNLK